MWNTVLCACHKHCNFVIFMLSKLCVAKIWWMCENPLLCFLFGYDSCNKWAVLMHNLLSVVVKGKNVILLWIGKC